MAIVSVGLRVRGELGRPDGSSDATRFLCFAELPLLPVEGLHLVDEHAHSAPLRAASVLLGYWMGWGWVASLSLVLMAFVWDPTAPFALALTAAGASIALVELYLWSYWRTRASRRTLTGLLLLTVPAASLGLGFWIDLRDRVELQLRRCDAGVLDQCLEAGRRYELGIDVHRDAKRAGALYARACERHLDAACKRRAALAADGR